ncbi:MAG: class I adenylate-forming enzyme family protein [Gemmatimonadaceae bacterium]
MPSGGRTATLARPIFRSKRLRPIDYLYRGLARNPDAIAVGGADDMSYAELVAAIEALGAAFQSIDPTPGSRVGICARNTREHLLALLATYAAGKVWVSLNPRNGRAELDAMVAMTSPALIVADASCLDRLSPTGVPVVIAKPSGAADERPSVASLIAARRGEKPREIDRRETDEQIIKFSGGSTGTPKAVVQSVRVLDAQARGLLRAFELDASDVNLIAAPLTHGASCFVLPILAAGGRHVLLEHPKPRAILDAFEEHGITTTYAPPTLIYGLLGEPSIAGRTFPSLRHVIYSAAPMSPARIRDAQRVLGPVIETAYGQVEAPQIITSMRASELMLDENLESVGRASDVARVEIMDDAGRLLPSGEVGEIVVGGPLVMNGYLDQPELTAQTIVEGWLRTGDLGLVDERGYLFIRGRLRDVINTGGFKVFPGDVEAVLARHPAVAECCVFGVEDPKWGEAIHAAVRLAPDAPATADDLMDFVKRELDSVKAPKRIYFLDLLPRNPAGKVSRSAVRALSLE